MTTQPTPLPPSVAELRDIIAAHYRGDALNQLCALASRAEPAPVADEAAIEAWERDWDAATRTLHFRIQRDEFDGVRAMGARAVRLMRAAPRNDDKLRQALVDWTHRYGSDLVPPSGRSDTYGEGMRDAKDWVRKILAESPAGEWVEKAHCDTIEGALKETETQLADCRDTVSAQQQTIDSVIVACGSLGLSASELPKHIEGLRARLQAAEADLAAAKSIYHGHWDDCETVAEMMRSACAEAVYQREQFKARGGIIDKLEADLAAAKADRSIRDAEADGRRIQDLTAQLAAAQKERDEARSETAYLDNILEGIEHALGDRMKGEHSRAKARHIEALLADIAAAKAESARAEVEALTIVRDNIINLRSSYSSASPESVALKRVVVLLNAILNDDKLRAAQPQPTTAAPATVRQGDEVLRAFLDREDSCGGPTLDEQVMREVCRRLLDGKP